MVKRKTASARTEQDTVPGRQRLTTKESVDAGKVAVLKQIYLEKPDKNCWTAQAIVSTALGRAQRHENYNRGRKKGAVGPWRALADEYAPTHETFDSFLRAIERDRKIDEIVGQTIYLRNGKKIESKSLRDHFNKARREYAKRG